MSTNNKSRVEQMEEIQKEGLELFRRKNADYGDAFATYGAIGVLVRMGDKIKRLMSISSTKITMVDDESMYDTLLDLHNYSAMALMLIKEEQVSTSIKKKFEVGSDGEGYVTSEKNEDNNSIWCGDGVNLYP